MQHLIDLGLLVELAEEEGFDFRDLAQVVVNTRHRDNILCLEPMKASGKSRQGFLVAPAPVKYSKFAAARGFPLRARCHCFWQMRCPTVR